MHLLIYMQGITSETQTKVHEALKKGSCSWWHHLDNVWLVCLANTYPPQTLFNSWNTWLTQLVQKDDGRLLLMELTDGQRINGLLPEQTWTWIRTHLKPAS